MINLPTKRLRHGMITAQSIYNPAGASYLTKGTELSQQYINRLKSIGVPHVSVTSLNPNLKLLPPEDVVQEETRVQALHTIFKSFKEAKKFDNFDLSSLQNISEKIIFDLISQHKNLVQITDIRLHDDYTFIHCVNVAILSSMLGVLCHYPKKELLELTLSGLLHDIGKIAISTDILNKPAPLTTDEFTIMKNHPEAGRQKLLKLHNPLSSLLATVAGQHHEHIDGNGYPLGLDGSHIHRFSRIVAIADVYDALTSQRPYKKAYKPYVAYKIMSTCSPGQFDHELLELFFDNIALYPVGTIIKTLLGYAIVKKADFGLTRTPKVCLFTDASGRTPTAPRDLDLAEYAPSFIEHVVEEQETYSLLMRLKIDPAIYLTNETSA